MVRQIALIPFLLIFAFTLSAQEKDYSSHRYDWDDWDDWKFEFEYDRPFIELNYGFGNQSHENFTGDLPQVGLLEIKLGYLKNRSDLFGILDDRKESFFFGSKISKGLSSSELKNNQLERTLWRFGFSTRKTLGYHSETFSVLPYHQDGFVWSKLELPEQAFPIMGHSNLMQLRPDYINDYKIIERYRDSFRFGTQVEGGIRFEFIDFISINAGYEAAVIFPRHLFWKHAGSYIIEKAGEGALTFFINEITDSTPEAGPVVRFLLLNAYSYAFHILKQENMNWPFDTETPLTYETFKVGVTFTF